jgi:hypothetical protein
MASSFTLETLKTAIQGHIEDDGNDFASNLDMLIQIGEDRILRELPLSIFDARGNVSITAGTQTATKPAGAISILELYYTNSGARTVLSPRTYSYCLDYSPGTTQGAPKFFAEDYSETEVWLAPSPNLSVTAEALYTARPESLVTEINGTFLSRNVGDLLLASCMIATERFNIAAEELATWRADYLDLLVSARLDLAHLLRRSYSPLAPQPTTNAKQER